MNDCHSPAARGERVCRSCSGSRRPFRGDRATADFVLDYSSYDPSYDPSEWEHVFRAGLLTVSPDDGFAFLAALAPWTHAPEVLVDLVAAHGPERVHPIVCIDFDGGRFVSTFFDIDMGAYAGAEWQVDFDDPLRALPASIVQVFAA